MSRRQLNQCLGADWQHCSAAADLLQIMDRIEETGAGFRSLTESIDTTVPAGRMLMQLLGSFADYVEPGVMRSANAASRAPSGDQGRSTSHYPGAMREAIRASGALNLPRRRLGGRIASTASSFSVGSTRR